MEVLYHIRPYFVGIFPEIKALLRPYIWNRYLQSIGSCCMAIDNGFSGDFYDGTVWDLPWENHRTEAKVPATVMNQ